MEVRGSLNSLMPLFLSDRWRDVQLCLLWERSCGDVKEGRGHCHKCRLFDEGKKNSLNGRGASYKHNILGYYPVYLPLFLLFTQFFRFLFNFFLIEFESQRTQGPICCTDHGTF